MKIYFHSPFLSCPPFQICNIYQTPNTSSQTDSNERCHLKEYTEGENPDYISNKILIKRGREQNMKIVFMKYKRKKLPHKQMGENPWKGEEEAGIPLSYP